VLVLRRHVCERALSAVTQILLYIGFRDLGAGRSEFVLLLALPRQMTEKRFTIVTIPLRGLFLLFVLPQRDRFNLSAEF